MTMTMTIYIVFSYDIEEDTYTNIAGFCNLEAAQDYARKDLGIRSTLLLGISTLQVLDWNKQ